MAKKKVHPVSYRTLSLLVAGLVTAFLLGLAAAIFLLVRSENAGDTRRAEEYTRAMARAHEVGLEHILEGYRRQLVVLGRLVEAGVAANFLQTKLLDEAATRQTGLDRFCSSMINML